ncbi:MAG: hypothetical protein ABI199_02540 [Bacteroidia bacterium]
MNSKTPHSFHIPVMGLGFTIDTPVKVAKYGITSVVSIIEDHLIERMREILCKRENLEYKEISVSEEDSRAKRVRAYLDLMDYIVSKQIKNVKEEDFKTDNDINQYFQMLPDQSLQKKLYNSLSTCKENEKSAIQKTLKEFIVPGFIDVNIMTKIDKKNYDKDGKELPIEYSDALAAFRGYAQSTLNSSIIFSAGMNPRLFSYCEKFNDFFPDTNGLIKKKIILKVSDYRSALIQGKYLAKKGLWVSEFRIESGINCGGHAFISTGVLMGPILEEFKNKRNQLFEELFNDCKSSLEKANRSPFVLDPELKITAQGGIGNANEDTFLLEYYNLDGTGWGSPFLLVPEATNVDSETLQKLANAKKEDYYLSHASPLGVPFNNLRDSSSEIQRKKRISKHRPGSPCYKKFLVSNTEFTEEAICTASRQYQKLKIEQLTNTIEDKEILGEEIAKIEEKDCLCEGLGAPALLKNETNPAHNLSAVTICPGPNLAYFSGTFSLKQMVDHIYGRLNLLNNLKRPNLFVNELQLYVDYIKKEFEENLSKLSEKKANYFQTFKNNLIEGIAYYESLFSKIMANDKDFQRNNLQLLEIIKESLTELNAVANV